MCLTRGTRTAYREGMNTTRAAGCACWTNTYALGHEGHCCFLRDGWEHMGHDAKWREDGDVCHVPAKTAAA